MGSVPKRGFKLAATATKHSCELATSNDKKVSNNNNKMKGEGSYKRNGRNGDSKAWCRSGPEKW